MAVSRGHSSPECIQLKFDFCSLTYPVPLTGIDTFCRRNNCSINVFGISGGKDDQDDIEGDDIEDDDEIEEDDDDIENYDEIEDDDQEDDEEVDEIGEDGTECNVNERKMEGVVYPLKVAKDIVKKRHANLLFTENGQHHYTTIKNFSRLVSPQISRRKHQHFVCYSCMHGFTNKELLQKHRKCSCKTDNAHNSKLPTDPTLRFTNVQKQLKALFGHMVILNVFLKTTKVKK